MTDRGADTVCRRCQQDPLGKAAFVIGIQVGHFRANHDGDPGGGVGQMACVGAINHRQSTQ